VRRATLLGGTPGGAGAKAYSRRKVFVSCCGGDGGEGKRADRPEQGNMFAFYEQAMNRYWEHRSCVWPPSHKKLVYCGVSLRRAKNGIMHSDV
jgi:hypothetical protein